MSDYDFYKLDVEKAKEVFASDWDLLWGEEESEGWGLHDLRVDKIKVIGGFEKEYNKEESPIDLEIDGGHVTKNFQEGSQFKLIFKNVLKYKTALDLTAHYLDSPIGYGLQDIYEWSTERLENGQIRFQFILHSGMKTEIECKEIRFVRVK